MRRKPLLAAAALVAAGSLLAGCSPSDDGLTVLAAASTRVLNDDIKKLSDIKVTFVNAGSTELVQQLVDGAPGDVLITADWRMMNSAVTAGIAKNPEVLAVNQIVLAVPKGNPSDIHSIDDLRDDDMNLVVCDKDVPCGSVTNQLLDANGLEVTPVSLERNVADTLGKVASGEADAGFVYRTDAMAAGDSVEIVEVPHSNEYPSAVVGAVVKASEKPEQAEHFLERLQGSEAAEMWTRHGFQKIS